MKAFLFLFLTSSTAFSQPGDKITCQAEAHAIARAVFQAQEKRIDVDAQMEPNDWGSESGGEAGELMWFEFHGVLVDKTGKKVGDLNQTPSHLEFSTTGTTCVLTGYSLPGAN